MASTPPNPDTLQLPDVANTALATLFCRAVESRSNAPILLDAPAERLADQLTPRLLASDVPLQRSLGQGRVDRDMQTYVALRSRHFDRCARDFLDRHPDGRVLNLGCGLDTRRWRLGSDAVVDVDLAPMVRLRSELLGDAAIAADVAQPDWMSALPGDTRPTLVLAEGLFMYLEEPVAHRLVGQLNERFAGGEFVAEVFNRFWLTAERRPAIDALVHDSLHFGAQARFVSGIGNAAELAEWTPGMKFLHDWSFVDEDEPKLGRLRKLRHFPRFRTRQWVVHHRLRPSH